MAACQNHKQLGHPGKHGVALRGTQHPATPGPGALPVPLGFTLRLVRAGALAPYGFRVGAAVADAGQDDGITVGKLRDKGEPAAHGFRSTTKASSVSCAPTARNDDSSITNYSDRGNKSCFDLVWSHF